MSKKDPDVEKVRIRHRTYIKVADGVFLTLRSLVRWGGVVGVSYCAYLGVGALAGKNTTFMAIVDAALKLQADRWVAWIVATLAGSGWYVTDKLRRRTIVKLNGYVKELETRIDPGRSSSKLLPDGSTRKEDRDV